ncbi:MAG TPA: ThuA domain-containing protein [Pirellulales bacterium]|jgi:putative heme-binding domain-containing protein
MPTPVRSLSTLLLSLILIAPLLAADPPVDAAPADAPRKKIVLVAGTKSHGPGHHEYEKGARLLKACLEKSPNAPQLNVEVHTDGWPADPKTFDDADTIFFFCDGSDHDERDHPLLQPNRLATIEKQMHRGCGFVALHYTIFVPNEKGGRQFLDWIGGYFDYQSGPGERHWFSKIGTHKTTAQPGTPAHPVCAGLTPFELEEEYYYNLRFTPDDKRLAPILVTDIPGEKDPQVVAYAVERAGGGRGFGFSGGHFHSNWQVENFRKMILNALLWTAHAVVPEGGVQSTLPDSGEATKADNRPIRTLLITGNHHPAHLWRETTPVLVDSLSAADPRFEITVKEDPEFLAGNDLAKFDLIVWNYCNWQKPGLSDKAKDNFIKFLQAGGGLTLVHFANGAFNFSLPGAADSDWPEYRTKICRRVWDHTPGKSGHDAYGPFRVEITDRDHEITRGLTPYETTDELYFRQQGDEPIHVLATAHSRITNNDEPMAFVYEYGRGRVFQTVLGHDAASLRDPGTSALVRRGSTWAARRPQQTATESAAAKTMPIEKPTIDPARDALFGDALDGRKQRAVAAVRPEYQKPPLTVECRTRLHGKAGFNLLVANGPKESSTHWEIYTAAGTGTFSAYLPGFTPDVIDSGIPVVDGAWHDLAMIYEPSRVRVFIDGRQVMDRELAARPAQPNPGPLYFASYPPQGMGCDGQLDEVRISRGVREIKIPAKPYDATDATIGLWHFDEPKAVAYADVSTLQNKAVVEPAGTPAPLSDAIVPHDGETDIAAVDPQLQAVLLDRSRTESFLAVKADSEGRLFVGGREALFVYEPDAAGGYAARQELFRFPADAWVFDIEIRGDDLYAMTSSALYLLPGARTRREGIEAKRLIWGIPVDVHISFHGLAWGPNGDLYFTAGDPLLNYGDYNRADHWGHWTIYSQPTGTKTQYTGVGGVFRCHSDGSGFEVVATGLRGPGGLVSDHDWNLFTNDNDHESLPQHYVPARLLHVTSQADFSWPRGWMGEKTPDRKELLETMFTGMGREVPIGQTYYDEDYLPAAHRGHLLVAEWGRLAVASYELKQRGASYIAAEQFLLAGRTHARPVGLGVGRGGRVFATIAYMAHNEGSPVYTSDLVMLTRRDDPVDRPFAPYDVTKLATDALWRELDAGSWERRNRAHQEILRRGGDILSAAATRLRNAKPTDASAKHLVWLAAASNKSDALQHLAALANQNDSPLRLQALRALGASSGAVAAREVFARALADDDPAVQLAALAVWFTLPDPPIDAIALGPARSADSYVRQTAMHLLARRAPIEKLARPESKDTATRLAGVLAMGTRLTVPPATGPVPESLPLTYTSGNAFFDLQYVGEKIDLRKLARVGSFTMAEWWKAVPHTEEQEKLFAALKESLADSHAIVRQQAAYYLYLLNDPRTEAQLADVVAAAAEEQLAKIEHPTIDKIWITGPFASKSAATNAQSPESGAVDLAAEYTAPRGSVQWQTLAAGPEGRFALPQADATAGEDTFYAYCRLQSGVAQRVRFIVTSSSAVKIWQNGVPIYENAVVAGNHRFANTVLLPLEPGSNDLLIRLRDLRAAVGGDFGFDLKYTALPTVVPTLPEKLGLGTLAERLKDAAGAQQSVEIPAAFLSVDWSQAVQAGDAARGRKLFGADALGCVKCHAIVPGQSSGGGPSLAEAAKRFTPAHLVESVLLPSKQIAPVFRAAQLVTTDGHVETGLVTGETNDRLELLLLNATKKTFAKSDIAERHPSDISAMPAGLVKTPDELRDLLAYLLSENPQAP